MKTLKTLVRHGGSKKLAEEFGGHEHRDRFKEIDDTRTVSLRDESNASGEQFDEEPYGLKILDEGTNPIVDVIAVHGLGGHWKNSWSHDPSGVFWLHDLLPKQLPQARIFSYGYNSTYIAAENRPISKDTIRKHGVKLVQSVMDERESTDAATRPIIIIAHSLGGIVVKSALLYSHNTRTSHLKRLTPFKQSTKAIFLIGTPQQGADFPSIAAMAFIISLALSSKYDWKHHNALRKDSAWLEDQSQDFLSISKDFEIICFRETQETEIVSGQQKLIVPESSANLPGSVDVECIAIEDDHRNIVKFANAKSDGFISITSRLKSVVHDLEKERMTRISSPEFLDDTTIDLSDTSCLHSLSFLGMDFRRNNVHHAQPGTCEWILSHPEYVDWVEEDRGLLWIQGKPGSGKSTLVEFLLRQWEERSFKDNTIQIQFFFHGRGSSLQMSELGMFRSTLHQLLSRVPTVRVGFQAAFKRRRALEGEHEKDWQWHCNELRDFFTKAAKKTVQEHKLHIIIDALDEARNETDNISIETSGDHAAHGIVSYLHALNDELSGSPFPASICLSCRHFPSIATTRGHRLSVENENSEDISDYVAIELAPDTLSIISPEDETELEQLQAEIISDANGIFQWVRLVVSMTVVSYNNGSTLQQLRLHLKKTPRELKNTYEQILTQLLQGDSRRETACLIEWVCLAGEPFRLGGT